ncbi:PaaI family thioesterase [Solirubrobacter soli]|uniref:PaaI family thioesterase n=1 Tax=Solirubrobacter soli TaxID=363832 RepID=UPI00040EB63D|nr:PaaI family thioesterase [Solirubrobacter soli]
MPSRRDLIERFFPHSPLVAHLGLRLDSIGTDEATLVLPFRPELATIGDTVHGGAIATLIDTAGMAATWADDFEPESMKGSTVTLNVNYLAAANGTDLTAHAAVTRRGRSLVFSEVRVTEPDGRLVATGSIVQRLG